MILSNVDSQSKKNGGKATRTQGRLILERMNVAHNAIHAEAVKVSKGMVNVLDTFVESESEADSELEK